MIEPGEYSDESRDKLEELRQKSDEAMERKALERRVRILAEENQAKSSKKVFTPILFGILVTISLLAAYIFVDNKELDESRLMLDNAAFEDAIERVKQNPNILNASFHQELKNVRQIEVRLYIDYMVVDKRAKEIGGEVMVMLTTPESDSEIDDDEVGSSLYNYRVVMSRLDDREVASGTILAGDQRVSWE